LTIDVGKIQEFSYVLPKVYFEKGRLLTVEAYKELAEADGLSSFIEELRKTQYSTVLARTDNLQPGTVERLLKTNLLKFSYGIADVAPSTSQSFLSTYLSRYELINLKVALRYKAQGLEENLILASLPIPLEGLKRGDLLEQVARAPSVEEALKYLSNQPSLYNSAVEAVGLAERFQAPYLIESCIERCFYTSIYDACSELPEFDRSGVSRIVGVEVDAYNLLSAARAKRLGLRTAEIQEFLVPRFYRIGRKDIDRILEGESKTSAFNEALAETSYGSLMPETRMMGLEEWELAFRRLILESSRRSLLQIPFQTGAILGILKLKEFEVGNLIAIMYGIEFEFKADEILQHLTI